MSAAVLFDASAILGTTMPPADSERTTEHAHEQPSDTERWVQWQCLMMAAQDGDRVAYRSLLLGVTPYVRRIAARYVTRDEVEDAVQEILLVVHDIRHTYEPSRPFKPWLSTIAARRCIDMSRRRRYRSKHEVAVEDDFEFVQDMACTPDEHASREERAAHLHVAIDELPPRQREAIRLMQIAELTPAEASAQSTQTSGALKVACHRAMKSLKNALSRNEDRNE